MMSFVAVTGLVVYALLISISLVDTFNSYNSYGPYSITERRVPELILVLGSQPAGDLSHKPSHKAKPAVTLATLKRAATSFAAW